MASAASTTAKQHEKTLCAAEAAQVRQKALFILNKLTLAKFDDHLNDEFLSIALGFTSVALIESAIEIIVDKAHMEHQFGAMCADLCSKLARTPLPQLGDQSKGTQFRKSLLIRCQQEFEKNQAGVFEELNKIEVADKRAAAIFGARKRCLFLFIFS
jgi:hypothetical protein